MATGWTPDGAVQDQINDNIIDEVARARARLPAGEGRMFCAQCGVAIPVARQIAMPGVKTCVTCQGEIDAQAVDRGINRRGSKDSQLR